MLRYSGIQLGQDGQVTEDSAFSNQRQSVRNMGLFRFFGRMAAKDGTVAGFIAPVTPQNRTIRPCQPGFDFLEFAGIDDVIGAVREELRDFSLQLLNAVFNRRVTREGVANLSMERDFGHDGNSFGDARSHLNLFTVQFF